MSENDNETGTFDAATEMGKVKTVLEMFLEISEASHAVMTEHEDHLDKMERKVSALAVAGLIANEVIRGQEEALTEMTQEISGLKGEIEALRALVLAQMDIDLPTDGLHWPHKYEQRDALRAVVQRDATGGTESGLGQES